MIKLYNHPAPNPAKVALFLEEAGLPCAVVPADIRKGEMDHEACHATVRQNARLAS